MQMDVNACCYSSKNRQIWHIDSIDKCLMENTNTYKLLIINVSTRSIEPFLSPLYCTKAIGKHDLKQLFVARLN